jgi:hypothetical protein
MTFKDVLLLLNNEFVRRCCPFHSVYTFFSHTNPTHTNQNRKLTRPHTHALLTPQPLLTLNRPPNNKSDTNTTNNNTTKHNEQSTLWTSLCVSVCVCECVHFVFSAQTFFGSTKRYQYRNIGIPSLTENGPIRGRRPAGTILM